MNKIIKIKGFISYPIMAHQGGYNFLGTSKENSHQAIKLPNIYLERADWHHLRPVEIIIKIR